ncbi:MAG TPA: hypothetical protein DIT04_14455, partial [Dysgonomonas sp.]|nr:hypothetical protein [Dysgonomonas sp.]
KLTEGKEVNSKNFSAFNNIGTLYLLDESKEKQKQGVRAITRLIEAESFKNFVNVVADETFTIDINKQTEKFIDELLTQFKSKHSTADTIYLFSDCNGITQKYISQKFTEEPIHKIEAQIEQAKNKRTKNKSNALQFGVDLQKNTKKELAQLKSILGATNLQYKMLADNVAKEILQCSIDYFNESQAQKKGNNYLEDAMKLAKLANGIAANKITKDRIKDNINTLEEMREQELNQAVELLKSIKEAYEQACRQIDKQVEELQYDIIPGFGGQAPIRIPKLNVSINWNKVEEMKRKALAWDKVVDLIKQAILPEYIGKIKQSEKETKINEYKSLVDFLFSKLNYSQKNQVIYLCYWKSISTNPLSRPISTPRPNSTNTTSGSYQQPQKKWAEENPGCMIAIVIGIIIFLISIFSS